MDFDTVTVSQFYPRSILLKCTLTTSNLQLKRWLRCSSVMRKKGWDTILRIERVRSVNFQEWWMSGELLFRIKLKMLNELRKKLNLERKNLKSSMERIFENILRIKDKKDLWHRRSLISNMELHKEQKTRDKCKNYNEEMKN